MNKKMCELGSKRSVIRELFEYGQARMRECGEDSVFDFSLGNPNIPAPSNVNDTIRDLLDVENIHLYTSAAGSIQTRQAIENYIKKSFDFDMPWGNIYMTSGAAAALTIVFKALVDDEHDEFIAFAPYFPEYKVFVETSGGVLKVQKDNESFGINLDGLKDLITPRTAGIIINSPNNPSGNIYSLDELQQLFDLLNEYKARGHNIYVIADEPYRELVYDKTPVPYIPCYYDNAIVCYSWSKALSLAGERIGYIAVSPKCYQANELYFAICGAGRGLGYVCASSLFQAVVAKCIGTTADIEAYKSNRDILYNALVDYGYTCVYPKGAFYLFVKSPMPTDEFMARAKALGVLFVPSETFGVDGWIRISYCVAPQTIQGSLPLFKQLIQLKK